MTALNKQALRNLALRATPGPWTMDHENIWYYENGYTKHLAYFSQGDDVDDSQDDVNTRYVAAADPSTILALLDELEKEKGYASAYEGEKWHYHQLAESEGERADRAEVKLEAAEKRIAELESRTVALPPRVDSSNVPFTAYTWNCCLDAVEKCLSAAGIQVIEGEGQ